MRHVVAIVLTSCVLSSGCALGLFDEDGGGADNLPTQAVGPYGKPEIDFDTPADEPFVLADRFASLWNPAALARDDGGFRVWYGREEDDLTDLWGFELPGVTELPDVPPALVLAADAAWEQGRITSPSIVDLGGGHLVMFYEGGLDDPAIGRADSTDGGATWQKHSANPVLAGALEPGAGVLEGEWFLFYTRSDQPGIFLADSADGVAWTPRPDPVVTARPQLRFAFDAAAVFNPFPVIERTPAGQRHFGLYFNGEDVDGDVSIGYAGSLDGEVWHSFSDEDPILDAGSPSEHGPTVVRSPVRGVMFFSEARQGRQRIAVATHP